MIDLRKLPQNRVLGVVVSVLGLAALLFWLPNDVDSGLIEKVRRRYQIGDMLGPMVALSTMLFGGVWLTLSKDRQPTGRMLAPARAIGLFIAFITIALVLMRWTGPASVWLGEAVGLIEAGTGYRPLRDTLPWKITGFLAGGTILIWTLSAVADSAWTWRRLGIAFVITLVIGAAFDLPFEDLVLPPNGDV